MTKILCILITVASYEECYPSCNEIFVDSWTNSFILPPKPDFICPLFMEEGNQLVV